MGVSTGALSESAELFTMGERDPVLSQLSCGGNETRITECTNNTASVDESCPSAIAICQGIAIAKCNLLSRVFKKSF